MRLHRSYVEGNCSCSDKWWLSSLELGVRLTAPRCSREGSWIVRTDHLLSFHYTLSIWYGTDCRENTPCLPSCCQVVTISCGCIMSHCVRKLLGDTHSNLIIFQIKECGLKEPLVAHWYSWPCALVNSFYWLKRKNVDMSFRIFRFTDNSCKI